MAGQQRFAAGEISGCNLSTKNQWDRYSLHFKGYFKDTMEPLDCWMSSKYPIPVFEGSDDPIDPKETDKLRFNGEVLVKQNEGRDKDGNPKIYNNPVAVNIIKRLEYVENDSTDNGPITKNPFLDQPSGN